jgi:SAM-dependent methyltransferase
MTTIFDRLLWQDERILIDDLVFYLDRDKKKSKDLVQDGFMLLKPPRLLEQYKAIWRHRSATPIANILELGIYDGGSIAFWFELLKPDKYVALDLVDWGDSEYFNKYVSSRKLEDHIKTFWKSDQSDVEALRRIVSTEFNGPLDLIIDDCSHLYSATRASFETLLPLLKPGGLFIIEDWSWGCWPNLPLNFHPLGTELPKLIHQIVDSAGSMMRFLVNDLSYTKQPNLKPLIASVTVYPDVVVIERGDADAADVADFNLDTYITHRPSNHVKDRPSNHVKAAIKAFKTELLRKIRSK